ncbi:MAG: M23 family metallopeptidase [Myxococcales bacterium]|nr:M23 family metallopeptidase [Myxococcales bacterium]
MARKVSLREALGLDDVPARLAELVMVFRGDEHVRPSRFGLSSAKRLQPRASLQLWRHWLTGPHHGVPSPVLITNLFNHTPTPIEDGWSVRVTQVRDFRGQAGTYDSHNGTDFAVAPGTTVVAAAPGRVMHVINEYNRGGLKVVIEHGGHLITSCNHLAKALVAPGDFVERGRPVALSGYSGTDGLLTFPFGIPHVHFNVWHNGVAVDPFAVGGEPSLWREHNRPTPHGGRESVRLSPSLWDQDAIAAGIEACKDPRVRQALASLDDIAVRGVQLVFQQLTYPLRFVARPAPYAATAPRTPVLDLPFAAEEIAEVRFVD